MPSKAFLDLPAEIRVKIYERVFAGAHMDIAVSQNQLKPRIKRLKTCPSSIHTTILETCSQVHTEAFSIMASAIGLTIYFGNLHEKSNLDLRSLLTLTYAPAFLIRVIPLIQDLTYCNFYEKGLCHGLDVMPDLEVLTIHDGHGWSDIELLDKLPLLNAQILRNPKSHDAVIASYFQNHVMSNSALVDWQELVNNKERKFKVMFQTTILFNTHVCSPEPQPCFCRNLAAEEGLGELPVFSFALELGSDKLALNKKWLTWYENEYDSFEDLEHALFSGHIWTDLPNVRAR